jgi:hypothetical protein
MNRPYNLHFLFWKKPEKTDLHNSSLANFFASKNAMTLTGGRSASEVKFGLIFAG